MSGNCGGISNVRIPRISWRKRIAGASAGLEFAEERTAAASGLWIFCGLSHYTGASAKAETQMKLTRRTFIGLAALAAASSALAAQPQVFSNSGAAINGYDAVAYFTERMPVRGRDEHSFEWNGALWKFKNAENLELFTADPEAYAPQYGGYCAWAVARNYTASTDPDAWSIFNGKLYLNYSVRVRRQWSQDIPGNIAAGDANWPGVLQ